MNNTQSERPRSTKPPTGLAAYRDRHCGDTILVCGCGTSLNTLAIPDSAITIGVNDVGRKLTPDYLVVLNSKSQFKGDRYHYVETSLAGAIFTQLNLGLPHDNIVRFKLGRRGGTDLSSDSELPYTRNSPYVATCLAAFMGAKRIGLIGVDFTDNHFFARTGQHPLRREITRINQEYKKLAAALAQAGVELFNLSCNSLINTLPQISGEAFFNRDLHAGGASDRRHARKGSAAMKIQIEKHRGELIGGFLDQLAATAAALGYPVERRVTVSVPYAPALSIVWNGRRYRNQKNVIYCEHGWLPRDAYQVSPRGINADSHIAPFRWDQQVLAPVERDAVRQYLDSLREQDIFAQEYTSTNGMPVGDLPEAFLLVPLQLEQDTNIMHHVSPNLRRMQALVDFISRADPPFPVIYKQHPVDARRGHRHLHLQMQRKQDMVRAHSQGNIHQILKTGACRGIISLNSNVVHDGFLWDVPSIVLGRNIWPEEGISPFLNALPANWDRLRTFYHEETVTACRDAYIHYLMAHQWRKADAGDPNKVDELIERKVREMYRRIPANPIGGNKLIDLPGTSNRFPSNRHTAATNSRVITVNVVAKNKGWLFEDLKAAFSEVSLPDIKIIVSDTPRSTADTWLYLRASEVSSAPDKTRTLVQIHDQFDDGLYGIDGNRRAVGDCGGICLTQPDQKGILEASGVDLSGKSVLTLPLGAGRQFILRNHQPQRFTVAWVGRPVHHQGADFKRVDWFADALELSTVKDHLSVALIGERLQDAHRQFVDRGIDSHYFTRSKNGYSAYPGYYQNIDCLVITSAFAAGPNCLFEALASGVPVISTRCGWAGQLIRDGHNGFLVDSPTAIAAAIDRLYRQRDDWFARRADIRASLLGYSLETWLRRNIQITAALFRRSEIKTARQAPDC